MSDMNEWHVYEFCKQNRSVLINLPIAGQMKYLRKHLPEIKREVLAKGLAEFKSVPTHNWESGVLRGEGEIHTLGAG